MTRVQHILGLLELIMPQLEVSLPAYAQRFRHLVLALVERLAPLSGSTYELLASCLNCLANSITKSNALEVAGKLFSTSVLPTLERQLSTGTVLPGIIGSVLAGIECSQGLYPLTASFVKLTTTFIKVLYSDNDFITTFYVTFQNN